MNVPTFIGGCALLLITWLGITFVREVPSKPYPAIPAQTASAQMSVTRDLKITPISRTH